MLSLIVASALVVSIEGVDPPEYSERSLCDLWAGARCHVTSCLPDAKKQCAADSARCRGTQSSSVPSSRSDVVAACAKALLKGKCGDPPPAECQGVTFP